MVEMGYFDNRKQWAIILGGSSGMGLASAKRLGREGLNLIIIHRDRRSDMDIIQKEFDSISKNGVQLLSYNMDAINEDKSKLTWQEIQDRVQDLEIKVLIHSIAKGNLKAIDATSNSLKTNDFTVTIESMATSFYSWVKRIFDAQLFAKDARVIAFTSEGSQRVWPNYAAVSAAKSALESIMRSLALELAPYEIKTNCLQPGTTITRAFRMIPGNEELEKLALMRNPNERLTTPEDVANAVFLLCMDEASWINGCVIPVDGGEHLR